MYRCLLQVMNPVYILLFWYMCASINCSPHDTYSLGKGLFWHITDIHVDQNYSRTGNPHDLCHETSSIHEKDNGLYGNFLCDSPQSLVNLTIDAMKNIEQHPDFIIWTGDNLPHTKKFDPDWNVVFEAIRNVTDLLQASFPKSRIFPSIGNHDTFTANVLLPNDAEGSVYVGYLEQGGWKKLLADDARSTFEIGGYYSSPVNSHLRVISLNTILWYTTNNYTDNLTDPANQFQWLEEVLKNSSVKDEKVYLIGHVPPGYYNRVYPGQKSDPTFHLQYLKQYLNLIKTYTFVIVGQMFGHHHMDFFQLFQCDTGVNQNSALVASSITPWHSPSMGDVMIPVNPAIRLMHYDVTDSSLKDYDQYFFNLTKANKLSPEIVQGSTDMYELLYTFTQAYQVPDLSTDSLARVFNELKSEPQTFKMFFRYLTAGKETVICDDNCTSAQLCAMGCTSETEYNFCMSNFSSGMYPCSNESSPKSNGRFWIYITSALIVLIVVMIGILSSFAIKRRYTRLV